MGFIIPGRLPTNRRELGEEGVTYAGSVIPCVLLSRAWQQRWELRATGQGLGTLSWYPYSTGFNNIPTTHESWELPIASVSYIAGLRAAVPWNVRLPLNGRTAAGLLTCLHLGRHG